MTSFRVDKLAALILAICVIHYECSASKPPQYYIQQTQTITNNHNHKTRQTTSSMSIV